MPMQQHRPIAMREINVDELADGKPVADPLFRLKHNQAARGLKYALGLGCLPSYVSHQYCRGYDRESHQ
jgi:hypothetical protein